MTSQKENTFKPTQHKPIPLKENAIFVTQQYLITLKNFPRFNRQETLGALRDFVADKTEVVLIETPTFALAFKKHNKQDAYWPYKDIPTYKPLAYWLNENVDPEEVEYTYHFLIEAPEKIIKDRTDPKEWAALSYAQLCMLKQEKEPIPTSYSKEDLLNSMPSDACRKAYLTVALHLADIEKKTNLFFEKNTIWATQKRNPRFPFEHIQM